MPDKSSYLILGGCGFVGRNLVLYLIENDLASNIRIADKVIPALAYLNKVHEEALKNPIVEFVNANLVNQSSLEKVFENEIPFDYVVNCAAETRYGLTDAVYHEGIVNLTTSCAKLAAKHNAKRFIEISCGRMSNSKTPHKESDSTDPWTPVANFKLMAEKSLSTIPDLKYTILRPAIVYGVGDKIGITPRLVVGSIYKHLNETMNILWNRNLMTNTVHVKDLCRAICLVADKKEALSQVYNVVDTGCSTQGLINDIVSEIFNISTSYMENIFVKMCKLDFDGVTEVINDKHSAPWAAICQSSNVTNTPLSSFLHKEDLYEKNLCLDGAKLAALGFECQCPKVTKELVLEILNDYKERNLFP